MFSEELAGSRSRKRQEDARARRRQLKQQQQQRKDSESVAAQKTPDSSAVAISSVGSVAVGASVVVGAETSLEKASVSAPMSDVPSPVAAVGNATASKSSAVEKALEQRWLRQELQLRHKAATTVQSFYRAHISNVRLLSVQGSLLAQRLKDVGTLRTLIKAKKAADYVPPPATVTCLVRQLIFVTKTIPYKGRSPRVAIRGQEDTKRLQLVLEYLLMPGIVCLDQNLDPVVTWIETAAGRTRFVEILRLCVVVTTTISTSPEVLHAVDTFFRMILGVSPGVSVRDLIVQEARHLLPATPYENAISTSTCGAPLDLVQILRRHLLFASGPPIPVDTSMGRERCFSEKERAQNDTLFQLILDAIQTSNAGSERRRLQSRFASDILSVPLLTWRLSSTSVTRLVKVESNSDTQPLLAELLSSFVEEHAAALSLGTVSSVLPYADVPLTICPATNTQCLLANLVQMGRISPSINASVPDKLDYELAEKFFNLVAALVDSVPLGTFSSRESSVQWISEGSHHTPIVLSPVVLEHCRLLLVDSFVRDLFACVVNINLVDTERVLSEKNEKDLKLEREMNEVGTSSAADLAAKEARVDRTRSFWQSSRWARKLGSGVSKMLTGEKKGTSIAEKGPGQLMNTSSMSRKLAHGEGIRDRSVTNTILSNGSSTEQAGKSPKVGEYNRDLFLALCRTYGTVLSRWGGGGREDIMKHTITDEARLSRRAEKDREGATAVADPCTLSLLNVLCFATTIVRALWALIQSDPKIIQGLYLVIDASKSSTPIRSLTIQPNIESPSRAKKDLHDGAVVLYMFVCTLAHSLIITDDVEIHDMDKPIPLHQLRRTIQLLKKLLYRACCLDVTRSNDDLLRIQSNHFGLSLLSASSRTLRDLYDRSSRRPLCVPKLWIVEDLLDKDIRRCKTASEYEALLLMPVLRVCPFLVPFKRRLKLFERIITTTRIEIQGEQSQNPFLPGLKPGIPVRITRGRVLEDGLATLNKLGRDLRQRIAVQYVNESGVQETGVDVGGLFKEFWTDLSHIAFDPSYALFRVTEGAGNCLYPNPSSAAAHGSDHIVLFQFLGRILGKALFEGITIHPRFAHFFLSFLRGDYNFLHMLPDLSTLDATLYQNLMFLKNFEGDAEDLCLTFTVADDDFGENKEVSLIPNGADIPVTNSNKQRYIGLVAKHHVVDRVKEQSEAFTRGLWDVIDRSWLRIFNEGELQVLISGATDGKLDVDDMRANTRYVGGYTGVEPNIRRFWRVVSSFTSKQQADLLRFATSCERPPPLGFASMQPPFTIQRVYIMRDGDKLPTASTCFNVLKLPTYSSEKVLRDRLLYAIEAGAGFELT